MIKAIFIFLVSVFVISCDNSSDSSVDFINSINGDWFISAASSTEIVKITAGDNYCYYDGTKFFGDWDNKEFDGESTIGSGSFRTELSINIVFNANKLNGSLKTVQYVNGNPASYMSNFTGIKKND